jgi:3'-phosphoadenosine 5'-phosphosulfate sulfotransferase (PAPS reductase)/FAD synthetase
MASSGEILRTVRVFEFYVRNIWPLHRHFVKNMYAKRCVRCIASEKMVPIRADGVCDLCRAYDSSPTQDNGQGRDGILCADLDQLFHRTQGQGRGRYDALVLYSGGKDSTYMIRRLQNDYPGLRILALTINNGFMSPVALENIEDLIVRLNVDHIFVRPRAQFYLQLFRYCVTHLNKDGSYGTVDFSDGEFLLDTARRVAAEQKIPLIIAGYSRYQVQNGLKLNHFESPRDVEHSDRTHVAGLALDDIFVNDADRAAWWQASKYFSDDVARLIFPLYAWDLEEGAIKQAVKDWGLMSNKSSSPIATNHQLIPLLGVVDVHKFGYSSFEYEFCRMIREGRATKDDWQHIFEFLEYTAKTGLFVRPTVQQLLNQLNLTTTDVGIRYQ